ncbi:MAG TPA: family 1 glycosylhydrolase, partial [Streptosporangiaceae bacterium]|nr:family 1 glycosylhydrolase [Streptosporangiaceae bacterium]
ETTQMGWEYYPPAVGDGIRNAWKLAEGVPVIITENGIATADDTRRVAYTAGALSAVHQAMGDGIDVRGYLHWSALDNYEWGSFRPTFGLIAVDRETFARTPKPSARWLGQVARTGQLSPTETR